MHAHEFRPRRSDVMRMIEAGIADDDLRPPVQILPCDLQRRRPRFFILGKSPFMQNIDLSALDQIRRP